MDRVSIKNARFLCKVGVTEEERHQEQDLFVDVDMFLDIRKSAESGEIGDTVHYGDVHDRLKGLIENNEFKLIETIAEKVAKEVLDNFNVEKVIVRVRKPGALADKNVNYTEVEITR